MTARLLSIRRILTALAVALCAVLLLAYAFGGYNQQAAAAVKPSAGRSALSQRDDPDLRSIAETVSSLRRIHTESLDAAIPASAKQLLTTLKHKLRCLIANRLRFEKRRVSTRQLQGRVIVDLSNLGLMDNEEGYVVYDPGDFDRGYDYGSIESITVTRPQYDSDLIAVTTTLGICCGEDTSFYLFKYQDPEWKLILADETNNYDRIDGARRLFNFGLSWPDEANDFFVVTASVNPWCTSNWQSITWRVLRPGADPYEPRELFRKKEAIYLGAEDPPYRLEVGDSSFTLRFYGDRYSESFRSENEDNDVESLKELVRCRVEGDTVIAK